MYQRLNELLLSAFSVDELRRLVRWTFPEVSNSLPTGPVSPASFVEAVVTALAEHQAIGAELFAVLRKERPRRGAEIDAVERAVSTQRLKDPAASPDVFIGPIAAGSKVVAATESATYQLIRNNYGDTLAVEMEGYGFLEALTPYKADAAVIRGISDLVAGKDKADSAGWQPRAARNAAAFALEVLANL